MFAPILGNWILACAMVVFTAVAAGWDLREKRIPNKLTLPVFFAGWLYQILFHGWSGLADAAGAFAIGFGILFVLWFIGGGGGGDVKLMGALSVWMGFRMTLLVLVASTLAVVLITLGTIAWQVLGRGLWNRRAVETTSRPNVVPGHKGRRILPYAVPVALATWLVLAWKLPALNREARAAEQQGPRATPAQGDDRS